MNEKIITMEQKIMKIKILKFDGLKTYDLLLRIKQVNQSINRKCLIQEQ